jgi:hypothetical protein
MVEGAKKPPGYSTPLGRLRLRASAQSRRKKWDVAHRRLSTGVYCLRSLSFAAQVQAIRKLGGNESERLRAAMLTVVAVKFCLLPLVIKKGN